MDKKILILTCALVGTLGILYAMCNFMLKSDYTSTDTVIITLERTMCEGYCPSYKITINNNGQVIYEGRNFVKTKGIHVYKITKEDVRSLVAAFQKANYYALNNQYTAPITDMPSTLTSLTINNRTKAVNNYVSGPQALGELEDYIDEIARTKELIGDCVKDRDTSECRG